jgi:hypothetical protein
MFVDRETVGRLPRRFRTTNQDPGAFLVRDANENGGGMEQGFHSREKGANNPPQLVITFG